MKRASVLLLVLGLLLSGSRPATAQINTLSDTASPELKATFNATVIANVIPLEKLYRHHHVGQLPVVEETPQ